MAAYSMNSFHPLFPKLTMVDLVFMPGFSSVVGSAPSADGSHEACDCQRKDGGRPFLSIFIYPSTRLSPITFSVFPSRLTLPLSKSSSGDTWFSGCHHLLPLSIISSSHLLPLSLSPDFPDPCCTKLSLRVS